MSQEPMAVFREEPGWCGNALRRGRRVRQPDTQARPGGVPAAHYDAVMANGFRFALQAAPQDQRQWLAIARRAEELGYATLLMPDGLQLLSPMPALAIAAGATTSLQVGTYVLASPLRAPRLAAWDAHTLSLLSGGRFQLGIGTGRPEVAQQSMDLLGQPAASPAQRLAQVAQTIDELRALDGDQHTPVLVAAGGAEGPRSGRRQGGHFRPGHRPAGQPGRGGAAGPVRYGTQHATAVMRPNSRSPFS